MVLTIRECNHSWTSHAWLREYQTLYYMFPNKASAFHSVFNEVLGVIPRERRIVEMTWF